MPKNKEYELAIKIAGEIEKSFYDSTKLTKKELQAIAKEAAQTAKAASEMTGGFPAEFARQIKDAEPAFKQLENVSGAVFSAMKTAAMAAAGSISAITAASMTVGMNFEEQMSTVQAISMATNDEMSMLQEEAKNLGKATKFSASEVGQGFEYMAMAGWKTQDMLEGIDGVLSLAAASGEELGTVSDIVTDAMTAFGLGADQVDRFADVLAVASSSSNTNVSMMGETFKYVAPLAGAMGYSIEDTAVAIGLMANSGIKASQAGTALRSMMSRLTKPTKEVREAMKMLNLSLTDEDGSMKSMLQLQKDIRKGFENINPAKASEVASMLAGQEAMSGLLAIVNASDEDFEKLTSAINNSSGAAEKMADIRLDNLKGDLTILQSAAEGFGIELYEGLAGSAREGVQYVTGFIGELTGTVSQKLPTARREMIQMAQAAAEMAKPVMSLGKWLADNPGVITGPIAGIGTSLAAYKTASGVMSLAKSFGALTPAGMGIMALGGVAGVITGIVTSIKKSEAEAKRANLAAHFGDISLSISELQETAEAMLQNQSLDQLRESIAAMGDVDAIADDIRTAAREMDRMDWKIAVGMELTDSEREEYQRQVESFVASTQELLTQDQYALSLSVKVLFGDDAENANEIVSQIDDYFAEQQKALENKRTELNDVVAKAQEDNQISPQEAKEIARIREEISQLQRALTGNEFESQMDVIEAQYKGKTLDADSAINLFEETKKQRKEQMDMWEETYASVMKGYRGMASGGGFSQEEFAAASDESTRALLRQKADLLMISTQRELEIIKEAYGEEYTDLITRIKKESGEQLDEILRLVAYGGRPNVQMDYMGEGIIDSIKVDRSMRNAYADLYNPMEASIQEFQELEQQMKEMGMEIPEMKDLMEEMSAVGVIAGNKDAAWGLLGDIAESEEYQDYLKTIDEAGGYMPEAFAEALRNNQQAVDSAVQLSYDDTKKMIMQTYGQGFDITTPLNVALASVVSTGGSAIGKAVPHKSGGIFDRPHLGLIAEAGYPEAAIPIDHSQNAIDLWMKTGELLGMDGLTGGVSPIADNIEHAAYSEGTGQEFQIIYNPTIQINGSSSREEIEEIMETEQEKFARMMEQYIKDNNRINFA